MKYYKWLRTFAIIFCWSVIVASIVLQNLYTRPTLDGVGVVLVLLASFFAGLLINDLGRVFFGWLASLVLTMVMVFCVLSLPIFLGRAPHAALLSQEFFLGILIVILRATFPFLMLETLLASLLGALVSGRFLNYVRMKKVMTYIFVTATVGSLLTLLAPTNNYLYLYEAMEKVNMTASKGLITFNQSNYKVVIPLNLTFQNPTGYSGIAVVSVTFGVCYIKENITIQELSIGNRIWVKEAYLSEGAQALSEGGEPIEPFSSFSRSYNLTLNLKAKSQIFEELKTLQDTGQEIEMILGDAHLDVLVAAQAIVFVGRTFVPLGDVQLY